MPILYKVYKYGGGKIEEVEVTRFNEKSYWYHDRWMGKLRDKESRHARNIDFEWTFESRAAAVDFWLHRLVDEAESAREDLDQAESELAAFRKAEDLA